MSEQEQARIALNDAMLRWNASLSREDVEGDPRELVHAAFLTGWKAGREYQARRATDGGRQDEGGLHG